jgi:DNA invertase Pin-like site-specific DNA recombinase
MTTAIRRVAIYARVSTHDQTELRRYAEARGWTATEYVDTGVSGSKDRRPAFDQLTAAVRRHQVDCAVCWRLDRLGRNLPEHVVRRHPARPDDLYNSVVDDQCRGDAGILRTGAPRHESRSDGCFME